MTADVSKFFALAAALALTGLVVTCSIHAVRRFDVPPPEPVKLIEVPMVKPVVPAGWLWLDQAEGFSVYSPPGTTHHRKDGIDWGGGHFDAPDFSWGYYIGYAPHGLHHDGDPPFTEEPVVIDGRRGIIQRFTFPAEKVKDGRRWYSRLLLEAAFQRYDYGNEKEALDLFGTAASAASQKDMETMWRSIRFDLREVRDLKPLQGGIR